MSFNQTKPSSSIRPTTVSTRVLIVGGGPIGIETAVACQRADIDHLVVEAGSIGHTISWWAPGTRWFSGNDRISIAGVPLVTPDQTKATREQYLAYLRSVVEQFDLSVRSYEEVVGIERQHDGFIVTTQANSKQSQIRCKAIVLAFGGTHCPRTLGIEGETLPHVDGYLREPHRYFGRRVLIIGGRNSAAEAAIRLHHAGASVAISYRGNELPEDGIKYWLLPELRGLIRAERIRAYFATVPTRITPEHVYLKSLSDETQETIIEVDDVLSLIGYEQDKTLWQVAGVELIDSTQRPVVDEETMETNVPGIYAAGTAVAGTQSSKFKTFLENCHEHVDRIVAHLQGESAKQRSRKLDVEIALQPES